MKKLNKKDKKQKKEKNPDQLELSSINPSLTNTNSLGGTKLGSSSPKMNTTLTAKGVTTAKLKEVFYKYANDQQQLHLEDLYTAIDQLSLETKITNTVKKDMEPLIADMAQDNFINVQAFMEIVNKFDTLLQKQLKEWKQAFKLFDKDGSNSITSTELEKVMKGLGLNVTKTQLDDMIKQIDENGDGTINFEEFCLLMESDLNNQETELEIEEIFRILDRNGNGYFTKEELVFVMKQLNEEISETLAEQMINDADTDDNKQISLEEFKEIMRLAK